ncbi:DUF1674 domain-containing protein [Prosthecodimorpha staleyi]|uniref:DUF1674 domain-containing protein n=1 Tax=Prosthecodimorpha staleyi TaxID=2840188 RepID=A0A947D276_9HYPH|nr:DUF1674 domain-containing protein [Prosthecodimorpha staleyi]MBT9289603.1 DUF1674 domain-containing protein [Prosthecodimorpha staleyi]
MPDPTAPIAEPAAAAPRARFEDLPPAAQRALLEAEERRRAAAAEAADPGPRELNGRKGPEPVRYGDWEKKGIAVDF